MHSFKHPYLKAVRARWKVMRGTGMVIDAWEIIPNVPTSPAQAGFDETKLRELGDAAVMHAKEKGLGQTIYVVES